MDETESNSFWSVNEFPENEIIIGDLGNGQESKLCPFQLLDRGGDTG
ncbi:hypothetical protein J2Z48_002923 [Croceifilum oryzae]|uniref:Uncharacterized protein n=1 Tax=Croceifilum oryzae TaxID=1553429 RepID=A0AAJ1THR2_9BACL|nr:hypothetical protein [Croceifilum oryzae]MDQ0418719.1 hypothetical protein [Croceifilum oryzae]